MSWVIIGRIRLKTDAVSYFRVLQSTGSSRPSVFCKARHLFSRAENCLNTINKNWIDVGEILRFSKYEKTSSFMSLASSTRILIDTTITDFTKQSFFTKDFIDFVSTTATKFLKGALCIHVLWCTHAKKLSSKNAEYLHFSNMYLKDYCLKIFSSVICKRRKIV